MKKSINSTTHRYPKFRQLLLTAGMILTMIAFCGCGKSSGNNTTGNSTENATGSSSNSSTQASSTTETSSEAEKNSSEADNDKGIIGGAADAAKDVADGVADGVKDVADGVKNTVSDVFSSFDDAQDWFMKQLPNEDGRFEVSNSDKDLTSFSGNRTGYHIELHDNSRDGDTKVGDFYIDSNNGKVYRSDEHGKTFAEYDFSDFK